MLQPSDNIVESTTPIFNAEEEIPLGKTFEKLSAEIEEIRELLYVQMNLYQNLSHPVIISLSQELDCLLNQMNLLYKQQAEQRLLEPVENTSKE